MEELNCKSVRRSLWDYIAGQPRGGLPPAELGISAVPRCDLHRKESALPALRTEAPSVCARSGHSEYPPARNCSRERARRLARRDFQTFFKDQRSRAKLFFDNLLKPFAVPAAGGILASFLCFGVIVDTLHIGPNWQSELPMGISSEVAFDELSPFDCDRKDVMLELSVDSNGKVTDWQLRPTGAASPEDIREIGNLVLYSTFTPAVRSGWPVSSKRVVFMSHINVKG